MQATPLSDMQVAALLLQKELKQAEKNQKKLSGVSAAAASMGPKRSGKQSCSIM